MEEICRDLDQEQQALDAIVAPLTEEQWLLATPAAGWDVKDTIVHLVQADLAALLAVVDADGFAEAKRNMATRGFEGTFGARGDKTGGEVLTWWREDRARMLAAFRSRGPKDRIPWFGPDMSTLSFATARLMETWSHGQDVADTLGVTIPPSDRLRHVAHIGVTTRGWSYVNRGREVPPGDVRVELVAPSSTPANPVVWTWGPEGADNRVSGPALDFCLLVTQRRHRSDVDLATEGPLAAEWMALAQAFAGPPTLPRSDRGR